MLTALAVSPEKYRPVDPRRGARGPLPEEGAFGHRIVGHLRADPDHPVEMQALRNASVAATRLRCDTGLSQTTTPMPSEPAFIVILQLRDLPSHELWFDGKPVPIGAYPERGVSILDLERRPTAFLPNPFDCVHFHVRRAILDDIADEFGAKRIADLSWPHGEIDPVTNHLGLTIMPALERPEQANKLYVDHALFAINAHFAQSYGGMRLAPFTTRGGLAPWQERRAKELIGERLEGDVSLSELASECRLSRGHFARAFKQSTGLAPHAWLLRRRVERAKQLLTGPAAPIAEIALACGFADQSHLTNVFARIVGETPAAWRRARNT